MMRVSYGPPGHKGVTRLMAVGDDDGPPADGALLVAAGAGILGMLLGIRSMTYAGGGAALALLWMKRRRTVEITQPR
jgi:hypothetical protein